MGKVDLHVHSTASDGRFSPAEIVRQAALKNRRIRLVRHPDNLGPGAGIKTGLFW